MTLDQAILLGVLQGLTEFLPVSSSGHLVIARALLGIEQPGMTFEVLVHFGTLLAIAAAFRAELSALVASAVKVPFLLVSGRLKSALRDDAYLRLLLWLVVGSIPAGVVGIVLKDAVAELFQAPKIAGAMLLVTGGLLWLADRVHPGKTGLEAVRAGQVWIVGMAQAAAIVPGISRSGSTIAAGLLAGLQREAAARFTFLLAIPAMLGATVLELSSLIDRVSTIGGGGGSSWEVMIAGIAAAAASGYGAIAVLMGVVRAGRLRLFSYYTWAMGALVLLAL